MKSTFVYALKNPFDGTIFYIGKTINPDERLRAHITGVNNIKKTEYLRGIGGKPVMEILETCETDKKALLREDFYIQKYRNLGTLLNAKPTLSDEKKRKVTITLSPSVIKRAKKKAKDIGISLSEAIENLLYDYSAE